MTIKKFQGKTKEEAIAQAKSEMGESVVIMNIKEIRGSGLFGVFKKSTFEVTAAIEDDVLPRRFAMPPKESDANKRRVDMVADEPITIPPLAEEETLKDAFAAVNQVIARNDFRPLEETAARVESAPAKDDGVPAKEDRVYAKEDHAPAKKDSVYAKESSVYADDAREEDENERSVRFDGVSSDHQAFFRMMYKVLLESEVNETYINQLMDDMDRVSHSTDGLQFLISNAYQKMILKLGTPRLITLTQKKPKVVFFIGPTGVGKTTTIAKLASKYKVEQDKKVALLTADTYRIAAAEQLRTYANILGTPLSIVYTPEDIGKEVEKLLHFDLILVDTAGFSHKNSEQREDMKRLLSSLPAEYEREIFLVLSATTKYKDLVEITDIYREFCQFSLIFTKLDETSAYGNIYNIRMHTQAALSYVTTGQNVPDDIEEVDTQKLVKQLLGGR